MSYYKSYVTGFQNALWSYAGLVFIVGGILTFIIGDVPIKYAFIELSAGLFLFITSPKEILINEPERDEVIIKLVFNLKLKYKFSDIKLTWTSSLTRQKTFNILTKNCFFTIFPDYSPFFDKIIEEFKNKKS